MGKSMSTSTAGHGAGDPAAADDREREEPPINIQSLPSEILPLIFAHLPATECKNVRLTCKTWCKQSFAQAVVQKQKFVFTERDTIEGVVKFLLRSTDIHLLNLEMHDLCISAIPSSVWKECGHRMHTLCFRGCEFDFSVHVNVLVYCVNLTSLKMADMEDCRDGCGAHDTPSDLIGLVRNGVRQTKLRTFEWFEDNVSLPTDAVKSYFFEFPYLTRFANGREPSYEYQLDAAASEQDQTMYANFDECLDPSIQLERIVYNTATDGSWMARSILKPEWSSRLIELQTLLRYENLPDFGRELLFGLFAAQKNLQIVTLNELDGDEVLIKDLMFCIFEHCPNLRELQLRCKNDDPTGASLPLRSMTYATYSEFARLFSHLAKLECFVVNFDIKFDFPSDLLADLPSTSFVMERLHLDQSRQSVQFCREVLKRCTKLTYLKVAIVFDDLLQEIFKNSNLKMLQLVTHLYYDPGLGTLTDYGFTGRSGTREKQQQGLSIKCLQKLEHLRLSIYDRLEVSGKGWQRRDKCTRTRHSGVTVESVRELQFPRLASMELFLELDSELRVWEVPAHEYGFRCITQLPGDVLIDLATNLPAIKSLEITPVPKDFATLLSMCEMSKHLSTLQCTRIEEFDVDRLFATCPHLMNLMLSDEADEQREQFRRHPLTKDIQSRVLRL